MVTLICTVRGCGQPLSRQERRLVCGQGHSFDIARSGYCNLLQPQDRRSRVPGDSLDAVRARRRFLDRGFAGPVVESMAGMIGDAREAILDAGCGEGTHLAALQSLLGGEAHGTDISVAAIDLAARRHQQCHWAVANADRLLPYLDASFQVATSITARLNPRELRRVLTPDGVCIVAVAAPDDLIELRQLVLGSDHERDRVERTVAMFGVDFALGGRQRVTQRVHLDRQAIQDVMTMTYRGVRHRQRQRLESVGALDITLSLDLLLFRPKLTRSAPGSSQSGGIRAIRKGELQDG